MASLNNPKRSRKVYGRRKNRKSYFNPNANPLTTATASTALDRVPFTLLDFNNRNSGRNNKKKLEESGIYGGKIAKLAGPTKHVFDLDSDTDDEHDEDEHPLLTTTDHLTSPATKHKPFDEFLVKTVLKPEQTVPRSSLNKNHSTKTTPLAKKALYLPSPTHASLPAMMPRPLPMPAPAPTTVETPIAATATTAATAATAATATTTTTTTTTTLSPPRSISSSSKMHHTTLSRPTIPNKRRRRPAKRAILGAAQPPTALTTTNIEEDDDEEETHVFDLETLSMLPRPPSNKASNILAVKVAALARQRVRAQRNSTSINRLRRSSIMPGRRSSTARGSERYSTLGLSSRRTGGTFDARGSSRRFTRNSLLPSSSTSTAMRRSTNIYLNTLKNTSNGKRRSRRSSILGGGVAASGRRTSLVGGRVEHSTTSVHKLESSLSNLQVKEREEQEEDEDDQEDGQKEQDNHHHHDQFATSTLCNEDHEDEEVFIDVAAALQFVLEFLTMQELRKVTMFVDTTWSRSTISSMSWSIGNNVVQPNYDITRLPRRKLNLQYKKFQETFPWGQFLCRGGFKSVYKVYCRHRQRMEAVSVMDVNMIRSTNNQHIVRQEVHIGTLLSDLVTSGVSPNYIETYGMFQTEMEEPFHLWGNETNKKPRGPFSQHSVMKFNPKKYILNKSNKYKLNKKSSGDYCYIRMELCDGGDFEEFLKEKTFGLGYIPLKETVGGLFQMIASLNLAQNKFNLRHYDVKLLNFFLKKKLSLTNDEDEMVEIAKYQYDDDEYIVEASRDYAYIVKLADYGTADTSIDTLNAPIDDTNFATLENTPPDFLLLGNQAVQTFAADTFALGLSAIHLLTGDLPYEEILEEVVCPTRLRREWTQIWQQHDQYEPLLVIIGGGNHAIDYTLHDTLYRYFVLFGFPFNDEMYEYTTNPILRSVQSCYRLNETYDEGKGNAWRSYLKDREKYGFLFNGIGGGDGGGGGGGGGGDGRAGYKQHPLIERGSTRMEAIPGMEELVASLCHYNPKKRVTMHDAIRSDAFDVLRV